MKKKVIWNSLTQTKMSIGFYFNSTLREKLDLDHIVDKLSIKLFLAWRSLRHFLNNARAKPRAQRTFLKKKKKQHNP